MPIPAAFYDSTARKHVFFALVALGIAAASIWGIFCDLRQVFWFRPVKATVTNFTAPDKAAADELVDGRIEYSYKFHEETYQGSYPAAGKQLGAFSRPLLDLPHFSGQRLRLQ